MLPSTTTLVLAFAAAVGQAKDSSKFFPDGLAEGVLNYRSRIQRYRSTCANAAVAVATGQLTSSAGTGAVTAGGSGTAAATAEAQQQALLPGTGAANMSTALAILGGGELGAQTLADSIEAIVGSLGLSLQIILDNGWQHFSPSSSGTDTSGTNGAGATALGNGQDQGQVEVLATHFLQLVQRASLPADAQLPPCYDGVLSRLQQTLMACATSTTTGTVQIRAGESLQPLTLFQPVALRPLGPQMYRFRADVALPVDGSTISDTTVGPSYHVEVRLGSQAVLVATGAVAQDMDTRWPVFLSALQGADDTTLGAMRFVHVGWLFVSRGVVAANQLGGTVATAWAAGDERPQPAQSGGAGATTAAPATSSSSAADGGYISRYAALLGRALGEDIVRLVDGTS